MRKLLERGFSPEQSREIVYQQQLKKGNIISGGYSLTDKGKEYSKLKSEERAKIRKDLFINKKSDV